MSVLVLSLANTDWYLHQLQRRAPPAFDPSAAPPWYQGRPWPRPTTTWMNRYYLGAVPDTLPDYLLLQDPVTGYLGLIQVALDPRALGRPYLARSDLAVLEIIRDQVGKRPIYFSTSTGPYPDQLGLAPYLVGEGLVRRLEPRPVTPTKSIRLVQGRGFVDVPRAEALALAVYQGGRAAARPRPRGWIDPPSQPTLLGYAFMYDTIAAALRDSEPQAAARAITLRNGILANTTYAAAVEPGTSDQ